MSTGEAALVPDGDGHRGWTLIVNGVPSSHVDLDDPLRLDFEYMRWIADLLDVLLLEGDPLRVLHLGGGGCTLAQAATALQVFRHVALVAEPAQFHGLRYGNVVLFASDGELPVVALGRRLASGAVRARMVEGDAARAFAAGRSPLDDPAPGERPESR